MSTDALTRTSMALDGWTLETLNYLAKRWDCSKAEVMRRAVRKAREDTEREDKQPNPKQALDWLQNGGGLSPRVAEEFRAEVQAERSATRYWWEA